jgi:hypothetical protein
MRQTSSTKSQTSPKTQRSEEAMTETPRRGSGALKIGGSNLFEIWYLFVVWSFPL